MAGTEFAIGDRVRFRSAWLKSVQCYTGWQAHARGAILDVERMPGCTLVHVAWERPRHGHAEPPLVSMVNVSNLWPEKEVHLEPA